MRYRDPVFEQVDLTNNVVYGNAVDINTGRSVELTLDAYQPAGDNEPQRPLLVFIHGGGFVGGDKAIGRPYAQQFARRGWVVVSINYRLNQGAAGTARISAAVSDARQAVRWLRGKATEYRLDTSRFAIGGGSAGAITALHLAYTDLEKEGETVSSEVAAVMDLWGALYGREREMTAGEPPLIIVHGTEDTTVPYRYSEALRDRAEEADIPYEFHPLAGVGHGSNESTKISAWAAEFFYPLLWPEGPDGPGPTVTAVATSVPTPKPTDLSVWRIYLPNNLAETLRATD